MRHLEAALALLLFLVAAEAATQGACPTRCQEECAKMCADPFDYKCAAEPWRHMRVCGWDGQLYRNECCARCAGTYTRAFCSVPLAKATFPNSNPKLCTLYCGAETDVISLTAVGEQPAVVAAAMQEAQA
ncbi:hypothetical protein CHLNCDRAFT_133425 [Chlorella variabilis]|uniref:Kazal-like domain-containing protein n=1 Tax=Chlorella variabilis TaxID=554065 RepID=E1Z328_CHLVA|nr:hypothetical protein CHLNCDRAFT_133425 [Chlorella variabilis]EFN60099.1 hypothetical protein CHLNCDRAFT_133425 [Chlorella variabilis]|eukprot:XP_005852201.1 hypothetical protein CHLNCDRAFT_133425 [Chlorella variabilis]